MDGVPGVSFAGIKPQSVCTYRFPVKQSGTHWAHSHSGGQELLGLYFPLIIDPIEPEPFQKGMGSSMGSEGRSRTTGAEAIRTRAEHPQESGLHRVSRRNGNCTFTGLVRPHLQLSHPPGGALLQRINSDEA